MNIITKWTLRTLKLNKSRTIVTIIGIILSAMLITSVATLCVTFQNYALKKTMATFGNWDAKFQVAAYIDVKTITENMPIKSVMLQRTVGFNDIGAIHGPRHQYMSLIELDQASFADFNIDLLDGKLPIGSTEIVLSSYFLEASGKSYKVGDKVTFALGERLEESGDNSRKSKAPEKQPADTAPSKAATVPSKEYTVVGIMKATSVNAGVNGFTAISYLDPATLKPADAVSVYLQSSSPRSIVKLGNSLSQKLGKPIMYNTQLLQAKGVYAGGDLNIAIYGIGAIMFIIIMIGSIALIYNAFAISVSERLRQFGMLSSVGATRQQLRNSVLFEGFFLGLISIPIGIIVGVFATGLTLTLLAPVIENLFNDGISFDLVISGYAIGLAFVLGMVTILISAWIPTKKAANMSAMDAIRQTDDIRITGKQIRTSKLVKKLFGFEGELALKNLKRNKKKFRATVFSFFISIVLFIVVSSFTMYLKNTAYISTTEGIDGDILISFVHGKYENEQKLIGELTAIPAVTDYSAYKTMNKIVSIPTKALNHSFQKDLYPGKQAEYLGLGLSIYGMNDQDYRKYLEAEGLIFAEYNDPNNPKAIAINRTSYVNKNNTMVYSDILMSNLPVQAQILSLLNQRSPAYQVYGGEWEDLGGKMTEFGVIKNKVAIEADLSNYFDLQAASVYSIAIAHETGNAPAGIAGISSSNINAAKIELLVSDTLFEELMKTTPHEGSEFAQVILNADDSKEIMNQAFDVFVKNGVPATSLYSNKAKAQQAKNIWIIVSIFCYSFITLITLIAVVNVFNTISTNIYLRRREFAMLKSVGMTPRSFNKMIIFESTFYGIQALFYGLLVGITISFAIHYLLEKVVNGTTGTLPWINILSCIVGVFVIVFMTMRYAMAKVNKANIIDVLKTDTL
ncbi:ABC transporter permease [Paenibacillus psychroresistens]|uniref:ABC transporter permease n=1 Tax=Paenibacillus psychroresistens TaxID=1778678 RepID=A0A6B8RLV9_9BACL|nr:ABC transporter permease [Paenibacillus psychroresistens]QGQ97300.1 ABC transporter permease [Paenibacillus psychroresistens]